MSRKYPYVFLSIFMLLFASISVSAGSSDSWAIETVKNGIDKVVSISMALDKENNPHAVYCNGSNFDINYVYYNGTAWVIDILPYKGDLYPSLALDKLGKPHIIYPGYHTISYASLSNSSWEVMDVDPTHNFESMFPSIALDSSGNPHISYVLLNNSCPTPDIIQYATLNNGVWHIETIDKAGVAYSTSIALDSQGHPHVFYISSDYSTDHLRYAWFDGENWHKETVDSAPSPSLEFDSMVLDSEGHPHICYENREYNEDYTNITKVDLKYAWFDGVSWHKERIASGLSGSLALDSKGRGRIAYSEFDNAHLIYAWFDGERWECETVYNEPVGTVALALDANDTAHILFMDSNSLKYAIEEGHPVPDANFSGSSQQNSILFISAVGGGIAISVLAIWYWKKKGGKKENVESEEVKPKNENERP